MDIQQRIIWKSFKELFPDETIYETALVLCYEFGDVAKSLFYLKKRGLRKAYIIETKKALGDLIAQIKIICSFLQLDYEEVENFGTMTILEHFNRIRKGKE